MHWVAALGAGHLQVALNRERLATVLSRALAEVPERHKAFELRGEQAEYARAYLMVSPGGPCGYGPSRGPSHHSPLRQPCTAVGSSQLVPDWDGCSAL